MPSYATASDGIVVSVIGAEIWEGDERRKFQCLESGDSLTGQMARFARIDSQIRANRPILANRFRVPN